MQEKNSMDYYEASGVRNGWAAGPQNNKAYSQP